METKCKENDNVSIREFLEEKIGSLEELCIVRFRASETAVNTALATSEKAITKSENSQAEVNKVIGELTKDVISLRESRSQGTGKDDAKSTNQSQSNFDTSLVISIGFNVLMVLVTVWKILGK